MVKTNAAYRISLQWVLVIVYAVTIQLGEVSIANIMAIFPVTYAGLSLLLTIPKSNVFYLSWRLLALACLSWALADLIWVFFHGMNQLMSILYLLPTFFITAAAVSYFYSNMKKWYKVQLIVDGLTIALLIGMTLGNSLILRLDYSRFVTFDLAVHAIFIALDAIALAVVLLMVNSVRTEKVSLSIKCIILGYVLYVFSDLLFIYIHYLNLYSPNSLVDILYVVALCCFSTAALREGYKRTSGEQVSFHDHVQNLGQSWRMVIIFMFPLLLWFGGLLSFSVMMHIALLLFIYQIVSRYIQLALKNELLLRKEKELTLNLERTVDRKTVDLRLANKALEALAIRDALTGMYNRRFFNDKIQALIDDGRADFSILYMDLNHFKTINDLHGHDMGDKVLKDIAIRFMEWNDDNQWISRIGGDEFALIQLHESADSRQEVIGLCEAIFKMFSLPITIDQYRFNVGISIGVSRYPHDARDREILVKYADSAMYQAKKTPSTQKCVFYSAHHGAGVERRSKIELLLKTIDFNHAFRLHYQPQFSLPERNMIGVEALLRWHDSELGSISPAEFIPVAEETGLILDVGKWVIENAFSYIASWNDKHKKPIRMGINLSPLQFDSVDFFPFIQDRIIHHGIDPKWIDFEITENSAMNSSVLMEEIFTALSSLGVQISIDDFGTGYSSLSYIKRFDVDQLKIAKELIDHIAVHREEHVIIKAIIMMAKGMGLKTIAEGVETQEQLEILEALDCDAVQGYYLSVPLSAEELETLYSA